jgi:predicted nucleic acid-binding Zn ribbon protein
VAGYLDHYGAGEERRAKTIKIVLYSVLALIVIGRNTG